jgi:hypothetical protein
MDGNLHREFHPLLPLLPTQTQTHHLLAALVPAHTMPPPSSILLLLLLAVVAVAMAASPPYQCTYASPVTGLHYDLTGMWRSAPSMDYYVADSVNETFVVNVCDNTINTSCNPSNGVCQLTNVGNYSDGDASEAIWSDGML